MIYANVRDVDFHSTSTFSMYCSQHGVALARRDVCVGVSISNITHCFCVSVGVWPPLSSGTQEHHPWVHGAFS